MTSELKQCDWCGANEKCSDESCALIDHAVPDVPELVRYNIFSNIRGWTQEECEYGDYILYSQVAEIISAKDKEIDDLSCLLNDKQSRIDQLESELATIKEIITNLMGDDKSKSR